MFRLIAARIVVLLVTASMAGSCAGPHRDQSNDNPELNKALAFLREPGISRKAVEARLGPPRTTFEDGRVVVYRVGMDTVQVPAKSSFPGSPPVENSREMRVRSPSRWEPPGNQLIIEYGKDEKVLRHNLLLQ